MDRWIEELDGQCWPVNDDVAPVTLEHVPFAGLKPDVNVAEVVLAVGVSGRAFEVRTLVLVHGAVEAPAKLGVGVLLPGRGGPTLSTQLSAR